MRFGSICSGIEAATVAWQSLGWETAWLSEIDPFARAVLAHHYPNVPNLGDMRQLPLRLRAGLVEAPDLLCGGTPCQAFSVAGLRESLGDARGNLSLVFCEIANEIDNRRGGSPCIIKWENVPGVLSTKDNAFGCFLAGLAGEDDALVPAGKKWGNAGVVYGPRRTVAWRTLDAQYFGLAQRRKRVFVVASARDDFDPVAVLFELDGVRRDSAPRREAGEGVAGTLDARAAGGGFPGTDGAAAGHVVGVDYTNGLLGGDLSGTIEAAQSKGNRGQGVLHAPEIARCDATREGSSQDWETTTMIAFDTTQITSAENRCNPQPGDPCHPLAAGAHPPLLTFHCDASADMMRFDANVTAALTTSQHAAVAFQSSQSGVRVDNVHATLDSNNGSRRHNGAVTGRRVRRLTPRECERLQGFRDDYTRIPLRRFKVKRVTKTRPEDRWGRDAEGWVLYAADGPRYKALGNSWAVPVVTWIGRRIAAQL